VGERVGDKRGGLLVGEPDLGERGVCARMDQAARGQRQVAVVRAGQGLRVQLPYRPLEARFGGGQRGYLVDLLAEQVVPARRPLVELEHGGGQRLDPGRQRPGSGEDAAAALPMGFLAWIVVPLLRDQLGGRDPFIEALLICFNAGLLWILVLTLILLRHEQGGLEWLRVADGLWLRSPRSPKTAKVGGKVWLWVIPFVLLSAAINALPIDPDGPLPRDLPLLLEKEEARLENLFSGAWGWFGLLVSVSLLAPWVEELFFRGLLLPRMRGVLGRGDWVVNGAMFGLYHLHQPWSMPRSVLDGMLAQAFPTKRYQSTWMGLITRTIPSFIIIGVVLALVL
jgi:CAAX protease family protein